MDKNENAQCSLCDDCVFCELMEQEDRIAALECRNPEQKEFFNSWVSGNPACPLFVAAKLRRIFGARYETESGPVRVHGCPHCKYEWLEWCDSDEYPNHCPACGQGLVDEDCESTPVSEVSFCLLYLENSDEAVSANVRFLPSAESVRAAMNKAFQASDAILHFPVAVDDEHYTSVAEDSIYVCDGMDSYSWVIKPIELEGSGSQDTQS